jgi:hypothetical protein
VEKLSTFIWRAHENYSDAYKTNQLMFYHRGTATGEKKGTLDIIKKKN